MIELAYTSTANWLFSAEDIESILTVSRRNNGRNGITGILIYKSGAIFQVLEGDPVNVRRLYATLKTDPRHSDVTLIYDRPLASRRFKDWTMAFKSYSAVTPPDGVHFLRENQLDPKLEAEGPPANLVREFLTFVR